MIVWIASRSLLFLPDSTCAAVISSLFVYLFIFAVCPIMCVCTYVTLAFTLLRMVGLYWVSFFLFSFDFFFLSIHIYVVVCVFTYSTQQNGKRPCAVLLTVNKTG